MTRNPPLSNLPYCLDLLFFSQEKQREMEEMASLWSYQENIDELKQKLLYTSFELESVRLEAREEMRKNKEYVNNLLQLLKICCQERDEARDQLEKLLNKAMPQIQPESPLIKPTKANSAITESNSLSETYNYQSHGSSPTDSFFDAVSSPELSNIKSDDEASLVISNLVKGKTLPQKGKLLQAVLEAGPLLQTLLVAGPLPRWRNPPPIQPFQIPPVSIKGCDAQPVTQKPDLSSYIEMPCGSSQMLSSSCLGSYIAIGKRQRFQ